MVKLQKIQTKYITNDYCIMPRLTKIPSLKNIISFFRNNSFSCLRLCTSTSSDFISGKGNCAIEQPTVDSTMIIPGYMEHDPKEIVHSYYRKDKHNTNWIVSNIFSFFNWIFFYFVKPFIQSKDETIV